MSLIEKAKEFVKEYNLVIDKSKSSDEILHIRSSIRTDEEASVFIDKFSEKTNTSWRIHFANYSPKKVICHKHWVCHRSNITRNKFHYKNNDCEAKLDLLVKKVNKGTKKNDIFLERQPPLPCIIRMQFKHNHNCRDDLYLKVSNQIKDMFFGYFEKGYGPTKAMKLNEENVKTNETIRRSPRLTPTKRQVLYLYDVWRHKKRVSGVVCEDPELLLTVDVEDLIKAMPQVISPRKSKKASEVLPVSQTSKSAIKDTVPFLPVPKNQSIQQAITPINSGLNKTNMRKIFFIKRPMPNQHNGVSSANDLSDLIRTVVNSRSIIRSVIPTLSSAQVSSTRMPQVTSIVTSQISTAAATKISSLSSPTSVMPKISSVISLENVIPQASKDVLPQASKNVLPQASKDVPQTSKEVIPQVSNDVASQASKDVFILPDKENTPELFAESKSQTSVSTPLNNSSVKISSNRFLHTNNYLHFRRGFKTYGSTMKLLKKLQPKTHANLHSVSKFQSLVSSRTNSIAFKKAEFSKTDKEVSPSHTLLPVSEQQTANHGISSAPKSSEPSSQQPFLTLSTQNSLCSVSKPNASGNYVQTCSTSNISVTQTNIHITDALHKTGGQISMKSSDDRLSQFPIPVSYLEPKTDSHLPVAEIKIKEEPLDEEEMVDLTKSKTQEPMPTITNVSSVDSAYKLFNEVSVSERKVKEENESLDEEEEMSDSSESEMQDPTPTITNTSLVNSARKLIYNEAIAVSQIKVEEENDSMEIDNAAESKTVQSEDILRTVESQNILPNRSGPPINEDEDYQFLMSLLPELKRIPKDLKVKLKGQVQNLILSTRLSSYKRVGEINNIYHDCRILPSFPILK